MEQEVWEIVLLMLIISIVIIRTIKNRKINKLIHKIIILIINYHKDHNVKIVHSPIYLHPHTQKNLNSQLHHQNHLH